MTSSQPLFCARYRPSEHGDSDKDSRQRDLIAEEMEGEGEKGKAAEIVRVAAERDSEWSGKENEDFRDPSDAQDTESANKIRNEPQENKVKGENCSCESGGITCLVHLPLFKLYCTVQSVIC